MTAADDSINALYKLPLAEFTVARNALAKTLKGEAAKKIRALAKPTVVPWAVNQVYWHARSTYDKALEGGKALRTAQLAALKGHKADVRAATDAHRKAIGDAVRRAIELAAAHNTKPDSEPLTRMFEALSLAAEPPEAHGRLTEILQPAGFESLAGIAIAAPRAVPRAAAAHPRGAEASTHGSGLRAQGSGDKAQGSGLKTQASARKAAEEQRRAERERKIAEEAVAKAARELERAKMLESAARRDAERATFAVRRAEEALAAAKLKLEAPEP